MMFTYYNIIRKILCLMVCCLLAMALPAQQTSKKIKQLKNQREQLQKKISQSEKQLKTTNLSVKKSLAGLAVLNGQIEKQQRNINDLQIKIDSLGKQIHRLDTELKELNRQLNDKRQKYRTSMRYLYNNRKSQNKLLFILSADNFTQALRRYNYVKQYAKYQKVQGLVIQRKEEQARKVQQKLMKAKSEQNQALVGQEAEKGKLVTQQDKQKKAVKALQNKQKQIQGVLATSRKEVAQLNSKIEYYVQLAIEQERKRREAEERKKQIQLQTDGKKKTQTTTETSDLERKKAAPMHVYRESSKEYKLAQNFASNKGRLPVPITGPYVITSHFGSYSMQGLKGVRLDNKGVNLTTHGSSNARAIFDGKVSAVFSFGGLKNILVRHGSYISVYCNLSSVNVKEGQQVFTRQSLGSVARDANGTYTLHFQLRKEAATLNPERWLAR